MIVTKYVITCFAEPGYYYKKNDLAYGFKQIIFNEYERTRVNLGSSNIRPIRYWLTQDISRAAVYVREKRAHTAIQKDVVEYYKNTTPISGLVASCYGENDCKIARRILLKFDDYVSSYISVTPIQIDEEERDSNKYEFRTDKLGILTVDNKRGICNMCGLRMARKYKNLHTSIKVRPTYGSNISFCYVCAEKIAEAFGKIEKPDVYDNIKDEQFICHL